MDKKAMKAERLRVRELARSGKVDSVADPNTLLLSQPPELSMSESTVSEEDRRQRTFTIAEAATEPIIDLTGGDTTGPLSPQALSVSAALLQGNSSHLQKSGIKSEDAIRKTRVHSYETPPAVIQLPSSIGVETRGRKRKPDEGKTRKEGSGLKRIATSLSAKLPAQSSSKSAPAEKGKSGGVREAEQAGSSKGLNLGGGDEGVLPQDLMNQLSGKTVPIPEQQNDPIRQIMNKGVEDLRKERGLEKTAELAKAVTSVDKGKASAQEAQDRVNALVGEIFGPELEQGEINEDQATVGSKNTTDAETTVPTSSTALTDQPLVAAPKSIVLTAPTSVSGIIHPDRVPSIPEKNVGKQSSESLKGKSPLSRTNVPHEEPRDWAKFKADGGAPQTLEQMFQIFKDFERKNEAAFNRLNRDSKIQNDLMKKCDGNVDALRKDFSSNHSMIAEHTKQFTVVYERAAEDAKFYRDENIFLKERIDHLSYQIHLVNQSNQSNTPQDALKTQAGTSAGVPHVSAQVTPQVVTNVATLTQNSQDVITVPRDLHYNMYNDGYDESLIRAARRGLLREETLSDKRVVSLGFRRYAELVQAFNSAGENFHIQRPRGGPSYESQDRGRH